MRKYNRYEAGMKFGKLTLVKRGEVPRIWECICDCGTVVYTQISHGRRACKSCAYKELGEKRKKHGESNNKSRLYNIWIGIKTRCYNKNHKSYERYGKENITMCQEWKTDYLDFKQWSEQNGYKETLEIDRIDYYGNYTPENCRWVTKKQQMRNTKKNRNIKIDGKTLAFAEWLEIMGLERKRTYRISKKQNKTVEEYLTEQYFLQEMEKPEMQNIPKRMQG